MAALGASPNGRFLASGQRRIPTHADQPQYSMSSLKADIRRVGVSSEKCGKRLSPKWREGAAFEPAVPKNIATDQDLRDEGGQRDGSTDLNCPVRNQQEQGG